MMTNAEKRETQIKIKPISCELWMLGDVVDIEIDSGYMWFTREIPCFDWEPGDPEDDKVWFNDGLELDDVTFTKKPLKRDVDDSSWPLKKIKITIKEINPE